MTQYLFDFLTACRYEPSDIAYLTDVYKRILQNETAHACFAEAEEQYRVGKQDAVLPLADKAADAVGVHRYTAELLVYLVLSRILKERYDEKGYDESLFYHTLLDLRYKLEECKAVKGIVGSFVAGWFAGFFDMTRFTFGRLQFEVIPFGEHYEKDGKRLCPDTSVLNVHIPRTGTRLDREECEKAYRQAAAFFADRLNSDVAFVCHSWLLFPKNADILPEKSNIVAFMGRYDVFKWGFDPNGNDLWRLFDTDERHPDRLPTDTSARRCYAEYLKNGGMLGWGRGVFFL